MPQITLYLDAKTEMRMKAAAKAAGTSQSQWVGALIREKTASTWPPAVVALAGAWADEPFAEVPRRSATPDLPRELL
ncbi:MAG: CopG family transcriptional regulator [Thermoanaerobaculia bacterium]